MTEVEKTSQQVRVNFLLTDLEDCFVKMNSDVENYIKEGSLLDEETERLGLARDRMELSVVMVSHQLKKMSKFNKINKIIDDRIPNSNLAIHLRLIMLYAFSMGQIMHDEKIAKRSFDLERVKPAVEGKVAAKHRRAEQLRPLIERATRRSGGEPRTKGLGRLLSEVRKVNGFEKLDPKTLASYVNIIVGNGKNDDPPDCFQEKRRSSLYIINKGFPH